MEDKDQIVLEQLEQAGSDLSKLHKIDFVLCFPTEDKANEAQKLITYFLESTEVRIVPSDYNDYLFEIQKRLVPDLKTLGEIREQLSRIALEFNGNYDGWGAMVEK